ncbi:MAG: eL43 family ribosomal protein [Cuniculiplasma sp.]
MLQLSKSLTKRKKAIAIVVAQLLSNIYQDVEPTHEMNRIIDLLKDESKSVTTAYGTTSGEEVSKLISEEGLDMDEVNRRILLYRNRRRLKKGRTRSQLVGDLANYLSDYCSQAKTYEELVDQIKHMPKMTHKPLGGGFDLDNENVPVFLETLTDEERKKLLQKVNEKIAQGGKEFEIGEDLERYLNEVGMKYGIDCSVDDFETMGKSYFGIKVFIGDRGIIGWFHGTFEELKAALSKEIELEAQDKVKCPYCGRKIVRYVAMNILKNCDCGAKIEIVRESVRKGNVTHMKRNIAFLKLKET